MTCDWTAPPATNTFTGHLASVQSQALSGSLATVSSAADSCVSHDDRHAAVDRPAPRSAERRPLGYPGPWLPEPLAAPYQESAGARLSATTAFLCLLEQLTPTQRAVFLLREVFELDFDVIASSIGKTQANTRQILRRARAGCAEPASAFQRVAS